MSQELGNGGICSEKQGESDLFFFFFWLGVLSLLDSLKIIKLLI